RVLDTGGVLGKDLPERSGVSKEAIAMALGVLTKRDLAVVGAASGGGRFRAARLTGRGQEGQWAYTDAVSQLDTRLARRLGAGTVSGLRAALEPLAGDPAESAQ